MTNNSISFNLVDRPWIRARTLSGNTEEYSILSVLEHANEIQALSNDLPTQDFALLRLLLAVLQRAVSPSFTDDDMPSDVWGGLWSSKTLPMKEIAAYCDKWRHRFDLFSAGAPFFQTARLSPCNADNGIKGIELLVADLPKREKRLFSARSGEEAMSLSFAEAARWLVHVQAFDIAGIKTGMQGDDAVAAGSKRMNTCVSGWAGRIGGLYAEGENLKETLLLNSVLSDKGDFGQLPSESDLPEWEREPSKVGSIARNPTGPMDLYTCQTRRLLLSRHDMHVDGVLITYGDDIECRDKMNIEPMTGWRRSKAQEKKLNRAIVYMPSEHQPDRALWRGLNAVLPIRDSPSQDVQFLSPLISEWVGYLRSSSGGGWLKDRGMVSMHATGMKYGSNCSTFEDCFDDRLEMPVFLFSPEGHQLAEMVIQCIENTENAVSALGSLSVNLYLASGGDSAATSGPKQNAKSRAYFSLDSSFRHWILHIGFESDIVKVREQWNVEARRILQTIALDLIVGASTSAVVGRSLEKNKGWMTAARAELIFRGSLRKALPLDNERHEANEREEKKE